jgi:hypothetical protein
MKIMIEKVDIIFTPEDFAFCQKQCFDAEFEKSHSLPTMTEPELTAVEAVIALHSITRKKEGITKEPPNSSGTVLFLFW